MTIFQQFRLWLRRAPIGERLSALAGTALVLAVIGWLLVPVSGSFGVNGQGGLASGAPGGGSNGPTTTLAGSAGAASLSGLAGTSPSASSSAAAGPSQGGASGTAASSTSGCTRSLDPIKLGITLVNIAGPSGNNVVGVPSPQEQQNDYQAVIASVNQSGGVACHPLVADFYDYNPADPNAGHTACLQFVQDKVFAVIGDLAGGGGPGTGGDLCILQAHVPYFEDFVVPTDMASTYYPYLFSGEGRVDIVYRNFAFAAAKLGYFGPSHGFTKLGIVYEDCDPSVEATLVKELNAAGVPSSSIVEKDLGCPTDFASPSDLEQAVIQFEQAGVSTVTFNEDADPDLGTFTRLAGQQHFKPQYVLADAGIVAITNGTSASGVDTNNFDGAFAVTPTQIGALNSPTVPLSAATAVCDKIMTSAGLATAEKSSDGFAGSACNQIWMFEAAAQNAPAFGGAYLAAGLQRAGSVQQSYPGGPNATSAPNSTTLGQYWRPVIYSGSCNCWHVANAAFSPPF